MIPRVKLSAWKLLNDGAALTKYELAERVFCSVRHAQATLAALHAENADLRIVEWVPIYHKRIPRYAISDQPDVRKPRPLTDKQRMRLRRKDPEFCMDQNLKKRRRRLMEKLNEAVRPA